MTKIVWDEQGQRRYETGVDHGVLYVIDTETGLYDSGVPWNGLTKVTESPSGGEPSPQYADNMKYLNLYSAEEYGATIEAFTYPNEFDACMGNFEMIIPGAVISQQNHVGFGFSYRTLVGNDIKGQDYGYHIHIVYGAMAAPSEKEHNTVNEDPEAMALSWEVTTTPVDFPGFKKPSAHIVLKSYELPAEILAAIEAKLYGTNEPAAPPTLPTPAELVILLGGEGGVGQG